MICRMCGVEVEASVASITQNQIEHLDPRRKAMLAEMFNGEPFDVMCATCFNATVGTLNNKVVHNEA